MLCRPVINLAEANPALFSHVEELQEVAEMRARLRQMREFLTTCRRASEGQLMGPMRRRRHLLESLQLCVWAVGVDI